ncbi:MAG: hypothetical protein EOO46_16380 [Flavobacterium sp.]|nr:MAG: hypothetical protein EOO46_16380 [Flavobacterium sp.]
MSEYLYPNASLYLNTQYIQLYNGGTFNTNLTDIDNVKGSFQCNGQVITFKQLPFRQILGTLYDQYTDFNLHLSSVHFCTGAAAQPVQDFWGVWLLKFSGAHLLNQSYNHLLGVCTDQTPCFAGNTSHTTINSTSGITPSANIISFRKPQSGFSDITLEFQNIRNNTPINGYIGKSIVTLGHVAFAFDIFPIIESKINK